MSCVRQVTVAVLVTMTLITRSLKHFSTSPTRLLYRELPNDPETLLDVGCGKGDIYGTLKKFDNGGKLRRTFSVGADIWEPYLTKAKEVYDDVIRCDIRYLPIRTCSVDIVLSISVIEHLEKVEGLKHLNNLESIVKRKIIMLMPVGPFPTSLRGSCDGSPYQEHKSVWFPTELRDKGFELYGINGLRDAYIRLFEKAQKSKLSFLFFHFVIFLSQLFAHHRVERATEMLGTRTK